MQAGPREEALLKPCKVRARLQPQTFAPPASAARNAFTALTPGSACFSSRPWAGLQASSRASSTHRAALDIVQVAGGSQQEKR